VEPSPLESPANTLMRYASHTERVSALPAVPPVRDL